MSRSLAVASLPVESVQDPPSPSPRDSLEALGEEIAQLAAHIGAATYRLLVLLREFDEREGWDGFRSCAHWLSWRLGIDRGAARERVRVARALGDLPGISEAMRRGQISFSKVRAMTRVATPENEEALLAVARYGTAAHVEKLVRALRRCNRIEELREANAQHLQRSVKFHEEDGMFVLRARLAPEVGELVARALEAAEQELFRREDGAEDGRGTAPEPDDSWEQRQADALVLLAEAALGGGLGREAARDVGGKAEPRAGAEEEAATDDDPAGRQRTADRYQVVVHVQEGEGTLDDGRHVSAETWRRVACDASLVTLVEDASGNPLSVGRKTRSIPPSIRRALDHRDDGCQFPGCGCRWCDAHHVEHWADGGETRGYSVRPRLDGTFEFRRPDGRLLPLAPFLPWIHGNASVALAEANRSHGVEIDRESRLAWNGDPFDLRETVESILWEAPVAGSGTTSDVSAETSSA